MQKLLFIVFMMASYALAAQKTEFSIQLQSGLFSFGGKDASKVSWINRGNVFNYSNSNWEYDDYGRKSGFSYSIEATVKRVTHKLLYGVGLAFESVQSKMDVNEVVTPNSKQSATGTTTLENSFINLNPYLGKRMIGKKTMIDLTGGFDFGFCMKSHEKRNVTTTPSSPIETNIFRNGPVVDIRARIQLTAYYKKFGLLLGYSSGMTNYYGSHYGDTQKKAFSRFLRTGISYRLK